MGSRACGRERPGSDWDLYVLLPPDPARARPAPRAGLATLIEGGDAAARIAAAERIFERLFAER